MTKPELIRIANRVADPKTAGKIERVLDTFDTADQFLDMCSNDGAMSKAYNSVTPKGRYGLGRRFKAAVAKVAAEAKMASVAKEREAQQVQTPEPEKPAPTGPRLYTVQQLDALVSFMKLCGVKAVDLNGIEQFSKSLGFDIFDAMGCDKGGAQ